MREGATSFGGEGRGFIELESENADSSAFPYLRCILTGSLRNLYDAQFQYTLEGLSSSSSTTNSSRL